MGLEKEGRREAKMAGNMRYGGRKEREEGEKLCHNHDEKGLQTSALGMGVGTHYCGEDG